ELDQSGDRRRARPRREGHRQVDDGPGAGRGAALDHVRDGDRFSADPHDPAATSPDLLASSGAVVSRPVRLVELPVGATEDRVLGSLNLEKALTAGAVEFEPGLLARAHRGVLYVDEVNLLHDHPGD